MMGERPQPTYTTPTTTKKSSGGKRKFLIILIIILLLLGGYFFFGKKFINKFAGKAKTTPTPIATPTVTLTPTNTPVLTPSVSVSPTKEPTKTPVPKPTSNPVDKATGLDRSALSLDVQNGSGVTGAASKLAGTLRDLGYKVGTVGNADNSDYQNITIEVKSDKSSYLPLLKKDLEANYSIGSTSAALATSSSADVLVIVGK